MTFFRVKKIAREFINHRKTSKNQTTQSTPTPRQVASKTSARKRSKMQKTHGSQNAAKASTAGTADTEAPRGTVRGKPAHATGATPGPAPALVRPKPRRTSRRAKRPNLRPRPRRRRPEYSVATAPRDDVAQPAPRSRARVKAAAFDAVYLDTSEMASNGAS